MTENDWKTFVESWHTVRLEPPLSVDPCTSAPSRTNPIQWLGMRENDDRALREAAHEYERAWMKRAPHTHHDAMIAARELRPLFKRLHGDPFGKTPERLRDEEVVRQTWARLYERWPVSERPRTG